MTTGGFVPGNELEAAMAAAASDASLQPRFEQALRDAQLFVPATGESPAEEQERHLSEGDRFELPILKHDGAEYVPAFSSEQRLVEAGGSGYRRIEGRALVKIMPVDLGLALNPGGDLGVALPPEAVRGLGVDPGQGPGTIPAGAEVMVGAPAEERPDVHEAVAAFAREHAEVRAAYRALVLVREPGERPRYVIGLELSPGGDAEALLRSALAAAAAADGPPPEMVPVDPEHPTQITRWMLEVGGSFYRS